MEQNWNEYLPAPRSGSQSILGTAEGRSIGNLCYSLKADFDNLIILHIKRNYFIIIYSRVEAAEDICVRQEFLTPRALVIGMAT